MAELEELDPDEKFEKDMAELKTLATKVLTAIPKAGIKARLQLYDKMTVMADEEHEHWLIQTYGKTSTELAAEAEQGYDTSKMRQRFPTGMK